MVEIVVADQATVGFATELAVLFLVHLLEDRALIPGGTLVALQGLGQFLLGDVHHADLQLLIRLGVVDQVMQAAPGAFQLLEVSVMHDQVDLLAELAIDFGDVGIDGLGNVLGNDVGLAQYLLGQRANRRLHFLLGTIALRLEFLAQQRGKVTGIQGLYRTALLG